MTNINFKSSPMRSDFRLQRRKKTQSNSQNSQQSKVLFSFKISPGLIMTSLMLCSAGLGLMYLFTFNTYNTKGYDLARLDLQRQDLILERDLVTLSLADKMSMETIINSSNVARMHGGTVVTFIENTEEIIAKK